MTTIEISTHKDLWRTVVLDLVLALVGRIPSYMRGATLDFDGETIALTFFFETHPEIRDVDNMQDLEAELVSCHDYQSDLVLAVVPVSESIIDKVGNWGWVFLRLEE